MKRIYLLLPLLLAAAAPAQDTDCVTRSDLADYALLSDLAAYTPLSVLAGYVTSADLAGYALLSDLAAYTPLSALAGYVTSADLAGYALLSDLSAYAPLSALDDCVTSADLANYATAADLAAATAAASNSFLHASPRTVGPTTRWHVPGKTVFDDDAVVIGDFAVGGDALFENTATFEVGVTFDDRITFGGVNRTHWTDLQSRTVSDAVLTATADDCIIWSDHDGGGCQVYLPAESSATNHTRTIVVRDMTGENANTMVYAGTNNSATLLHTLTPTNPTAVFDWCPPTQAWLLR